MDQLNDGHDAVPGAELGLDAGLVLGGRFRLDARLSHRAHVHTWRAIDQVLSRAVTIHILSPDDPRVGWVMDAARRAATVTDRRFTHVLDAFEARGQEPWSFVVSENPVGTSLRSLLGSGALTSNQTAYLGCELSDALASIHTDGLFHKRLGPGSVFLTSNGHVKIAGMMIEAAVRPASGEEGLSNAQWQMRDLFDLGRLTYSAATGVWPILPGEPQRVTWGMSPAPLADNPGPQGAPAQVIWQAPFLLNRQIEPELSRTIMAILRPSVHVPGPQIRSAGAACESFSTLANIPAAHDSLEVFLNSDDEPTALAPSIGGDVSSASTQLIDAQAGLARQTGLAARTEVITPQTQVIGSVGQATATQAMATQAIPAQGVPTQAIPAQDVPAQTALLQATPMQGSSGLGSSTDPDPAQTREPTSQVPSSRPTSLVSKLAASPRRSTVIFAAVVIIFAVALVIGALHMASDPAPETETPDEPEVTVAEATIRSVFDFDPVADGGECSENSQDAPYAADGDLSTVWHTLSYYGNPDFGGLKTGVGLVYDFGQEVTINDVSLILDNQPNQIQLMIPIEADASAELPPMDTVSQWQAIAADDSAGLEVTLAPHEPVTTRWIMVYFTSLPQISEGTYRSGIAETYINNR